MGACRKSPNGPPWKMPSSSYLHERTPVRCGAEIDLLSLGLSVSQCASLGDFLLAPACTIDKVINSMWRGSFIQLWDSKPTRIFQKTKFFLNQGHRVQSSISAICTRLSFHPCHNNPNGVWKTDFLAPTSRSPKLQLIFLLVTAFTWLTGGKCGLLGNSKLISDELLWGLPTGPENKQ